MSKLGNLWASALWVICSSCIAALLVEEKLRIGFQRPIAFLGQQPGDEGQAMFKLLIEVAGSLGNVVLIQSLLLVLLNVCMFKVSSVSRVALGFSTAMAVLALCASAFIIH